MGLARHTDFRTSRVLEPQPTLAKHRSRELRSDVEADAPTVLITRAPVSKRATPPPLPSEHVAGSQSVRSAARPPQPPRQQQPATPTKLGTSIAAREAELGQKAAEQALARVDAAPLLRPLEKPDWIGAKRRQQHTGIAQSIGSWLLALGVTIAVLAGAAVVLLGGPEKLQALIVDPPPLQLTAPKAKAAYDRNERLPQAGTGTDDKLYRKRSRVDRVAPGLDNAAQAIVR